MSYKNKEKIYEYHCEYAFKEDNKKKWTIGCCHKFEDKCDCECHKIFEEQAKRQTAQEILEEIHNQLVQTNRNKPNLRIERKLVFGKRNLCPSCKKREVKQ